MATPPGSSSRQLKILMLHGYTQSAAIFKAKTRALEKALSKVFPAAPTPGHLPDYPGGVSLTYIDAPHQLQGADIPGWAGSSSTSSSPFADPAASPASSTTSLSQLEDAPPPAYGWWRRDSTTREYIGVAAGIEAIAEALKRDGPFAGVVGFSQGAAAAAITASLLEPGRLDAFRRLERSGEGMAYPACFLGTDGETVMHPPLRFVVAYSGFIAPEPVYRAFYEPLIGTDMLHVIGSLDGIVSAERTTGLIEASEGGRAGKGVVYHPGGHFVPCQKQWTNVLVEWVAKVIGEKGLGM